MAELKVEGVVHWSISVNDLEESEKFYGELLGLEAQGRLGGSKMACFKAGDHNILFMRAQGAPRANAGAGQPAPSCLHGESGNVGQGLQGAA